MGGNLGRILRETEVPSGRLNSSPRNLHASKYLSFVDHGGAAPYVNILNINKTCHAQVQYCGGSVAFALNFCRRKEACHLYLDPVDIG